jgi:hypothetical protein
MALFFNLELLESESKCSPKITLSMLEWHFNKKPIPKNNRDRLNYPNLAGHSFLLDAHSLFLDTCDVAYKAQYIRLAGRRDYSLYKFHKITYLDLSYFKDINLELIKHNPLLDINKNKIHFKYEN